MGLDCSHDAFSGAYSAFMRFRIAVCEATGGRFDDGDGYFHFGPGYDSESHPGLFELLGHSDCDGEISPELCAEIADELETLLPKIEKKDIGGAGHILRDGGYVAVTKRFINGCREASKNNEPLEFM